MVEHKGKDENEIVLLFLRSSVRYVYKQTQCNWISATTVDNTIVSTEGATFELLPEDLMEIHRGSNGKG